MVACVEHRTHLPSGSPARDRRAGQRVARIVALHIGDHEPGVARAGGGQDPLGLCNRDRHRLLHEDVLAGAQQIGGDLALLGKAGRDAHRLHGGIGGKVQVAVVDGGDAVARGDALGQARARLGQGDQAAILQ